MTLENSQLLLEEIAGAHIAPLYLVPIEFTKENNYNPNEMPQKRFDALVKNIQENGFIGTITFKPINIGTSDERFEITDGAHRFRAYIKAFPDAKFFPGSLDQSVNRERQMLKTISMNSLHGDPNTLRLANVLKSLTDGGLTLEEIEEMTGYGKSRIDNIIGTLRMPEIPEDLFSTPLPDNDLPESEQISSTSTQPGTSTSNTPSPAGGIHDTPRGTPILNLPSRSTTITSYSVYADQLTLINRALDKAVRAMPPLDDELDEYGRRGQGLVYLCELFLVDGESRNATFQERSVLDDGGGESSEN